MSFKGKTILVGGGSGFIGSRLCDLLQSKNYNVKVISRMPGPQCLTWQEVQTAGIPKDTVAVVNLAGQNVLDPTRRWTPGFKQNVWNSRVKTTEILNKAIMKLCQPPSVFVTISGVGIYEPNNITTYDEFSSGKEFDFLSKLCIEWEKAAKLPSDSNCRQVVIRSGVVLGSKGGMIQQIYLPFFLGLGGPMGSGNQYLPWIHIQDLIRLILFAIETENVKGVLNGVSPQTITNKEFSNTFAAALSRPAILPVPAFLLNLIFNKERAKMITEGQKVLPKRTLELGFKYLYSDIESACKDIVNSYKL